MLEEHPELWGDVEFAEAALGALVALAGDLRAALSEGRYSLSDAEQLCGLVFQAVERGGPGRAFLRESGGPVLRLAEEFAGESRELRDFLDMIWEL